MNVRSTRSPHLKPVLFLVGPTAAGKSAVAVEVAKRLSGEIICCDAMQVYRGMDVGTAKPSREQRRLVPHHLYDLVEPSEEFSAYHYRQHALQVLEEIAVRGKTSIFVGGSGLYVRCLLDGFSGQPGRDERLRHELEAEANEHGLEALYERLQKEDAERARQIKPGDRKRIVRALEILAVSGKKASEWYLQKEPLETLGYWPVVIGITKPREQLYRDIDARVAKMFQDGLVEEVERLATVPLSATAREAIGYKEILEARRLGFSLEETKVRIQQNTRRYAKRQRTWFKGERKIRWLEWQDGDTVTAMAGRVLKVWREEI